MSRKIARRGVSRRSLSSASLLEQLEPRLVFDGAFVAVGIRFDAVPHVFFSEGVVADADDSITGTTRYADSSGTITDGPLDWTSLIRGDEGGFTFGTRNGFTPYASQVGTQFLPQDRWLVGNFVGNDAQGNVRDFAVLGEAEVGFTIGALFALDLTMTRITPSGTVESFDLFIRTTPGAPFGTSYRFVYVLPSGIVVDDKLVTGSGDSKVHFDSGETLTTPHGAIGGYNSAFLVDFDAADGIVGMAVGRKGSGEGPPSSADAGRYRAAALVDGPLSAAFFGVDPGAVSPGNPAAANVIIELNLWNYNDEENSIPNTFRVYRQSDWDNGDRTPITEGTWRYVGATESSGDPETATARSYIEMTDNSGITLTVRHISDRAFTFDSVAGNATTEQVQGLATARLYREGNPQEYLAHVDANGRPIVYMESGYAGVDTTYSIDLINEVGGEAIVGSLVSWVTGDMTGGARFFAGLNADGEILLWRAAMHGVAWSFVNLTEAIPDARPIASDLFNAGSITSANPYVEGTVPPLALYQTLAGYDADGNFVAYRWEWGGHTVTTRWAFDDVEVDGVGSAGVVPDAVGGFAGWTSGWGGSHFAGVDSAGELWVVWWAPGMEQWNVDSLSDNAGTPTLVAARPTFAQTSWSTFHVFATDTNGHVSVTWWAVGFDRWAHDDLTDLTGGPTLQNGTITAGFATPLQNLNVVGLDQNGDVRIYWWNANSGWQVNTIAPASADIPMTPWTLTWSWYNRSNGAGMVSTQTLLGNDTDGDLVRLVWNSQDPDEWFYENVTEMSTPYELS